MTVTGAVNANGNTVGLTAAGNLTLNAGVSGSTITLSAGVDISQNASGAITGTTLSIADANDVMLAAALNDVTNFNSMTRGSVSYCDINDLTIDATGITTDTDDAVDGINDNGDVTIQALGNLNVVGAINATGMVALDGNDGDIALIGGTNVVLTAAINTGDGDILISDSGLAGFVVNQTLTTTGTVRLLTNGPLTQTAIITAGSLGARILATAADNSDINLSLANEVGTFAAENLADGGQVEFLSNQDLIIGNVTAGTGKAAVFTAANGVSTTAFGGQVSNLTDADDRGDILIETRGSLTLAVDGAVDATTGIAGQVNAISAAGGLSDARLIADGAVIQDTDGLIVADELGVRLQDITEVVSNENISLGHANTVNEFAARNQSIGGEVTFQSINNLMIGEVTDQAATNANIPFATTTGVFTTSTNTLMDATDTSNDVLIQAGGFLSLDEAIDTNNNRANDTDTAGLDADVRLIANGDISQDAEGIITANELGVLQSQTSHDNANDIGVDDSQHDVDLGFNNNIDEVAIHNLEDAAEINFHSTRNLVVGSVDAVNMQGIDFEAPAPPAAANTALGGVVSANGDILIQAGNPDSSPGVFPFVDDNPASLTLDLNNTFDATGSGTVVNSGSANTRLVAFGDIRQDSDGLITANSLGVRQNSNDIPPAMGMAVAGDADIDDNSAFNIDLGYVNSVTTFAAFNAYDANLNANDTQGGTITFQNDDALTVGTVSAPATAIGTTLFANTTGIASTYTGAAVASRDTDGDGTFEVTDVLAGDILIDNEGAIAVNSAINAGTGNSDVRLAADGAITQTAIITANELNVRLDTATANTDITLTMMNMVDEFAAFNASSEGDISFTDANDLNVNVLVAQDIPHMNVDASSYATFDADGTRFDMNAAPMVQAVANVAVGASGGNIEITAGGNLTVIGVTDLLAKRFVYSTDGVVDSSNATDGESITLNAGVDVRLEQNVVISTDENLAAGASSINTSDTLSINANTTIGTFHVGSGVEIRTDGGVALAFATRPLGNDSAFFFGAGASYPIQPSIGPAAGFGDSSEAAFTTRIGKSGEENLIVNINWDDPINNSINVANHAAFNNVVSNGAGSGNVDSAQLLSDFTAFTGGNQFTFGHVYTSSDLALISLTQSNIANVGFSVSHDQSIMVTGSRVEQTGQTGSNVGDSILSQSSDGSARFKFFGEGPPLNFSPDPEPVPNPVPPNPEPVQVAVPLTVVNVEPPVASRVGVSSQSFDYFQLRRNEGEAGYEIIDEQISEDNGESLLDPRTLKQYVDDNNIPDEQDYELWLITTKVNNAGQSVTLERPILKFDVSGGRPIPAIEDLPMEFPELRLEPIPLDGDAEVDPVENSDMNEADPEGDNQEMPEKVEEEQKTVSLLDETDQIQRIDGSHQASAIGVGGVLAVSNMNRKKSSIEGRRVRNASLLSRIFGGNSLN